MTPLEKWKILDTTVLLDQLPWLRVLADRVRLPDGRIVDNYLRLETPNYVMITAISEGGDIGLIQSYKHGVQEIDFQPPAGYLEPEEDPLEGAKRELLEETGCVSEAWTTLGSFVLAGNRGAGTAYLFLAEGCRQVREPDPGDLEEQVVVWMSSEQVKEHFQEGKIRQLGSAAALGLTFSRLLSNGEPYEGP
jgi:ADP-ribose pyrophosphatase